MKKPPKRTTTISKPVADAVDAPNPFLAAQKVTGTEPEAPPVSKSTERVRAYRARQKGEAPVAAEPQPIEVSEEDIAEAAALGNVIWDFAAVPFARCKPLDELQARRLGKALAPLVKKYLPLLGPWQYEIAFAACLFVLIRENRLPPPEKKVTEEEHQRSLEHPAA